jgi:endonuclease/exonuclease/phosphatase family metal-dependent hydrolase
MHLHRSPFARLSRRALVAAAVCAGLAWAGALAQAPNGPAPRLRVMSFNIRYGTANDGENAWERRKKMLLDCIRTANPDLLGVQEALANQVDYLGQNLPGYRVIGVGRDDGARKGEFSAIYLKTERVTATESGTFWLSEQPDKVGSKSWDSSLPRIVTWARLTVRGQPEFKMVYLNTHWDHRGPKARLESAKLMRRWAGEHAGALPLVLTGDLNTGETTEPLKHLLRGEGADPAWTDAYREVHPTKDPDEATFNGFSGTRRGSRIDFILHSRHFRAVEAAIDRTQRNGRYPSDHYPVTATLEYRGTPR